MDNYILSGSPFPILVTENQYQSLTPLLKRYHSPVISETKLCVSSVATKHENTLSIFDELSLHSNCKNNIQEAQESEMKSMSTNKPLEGSPKVCQNRYSSSDTMSNTSRNSIPSGIYKARIRRSSLLIPSYQLLKENQVCRVSKSVTSLFSNSSSSPSLSMEIERISQNYNESLINFYGNLLSAFTNLLAIETIFSTVDEVSESVLTKQNTEYYSEKRGQVDSSKNGYSMTDPSENNLHVSSRTSLKISSMSKVEEDDVPPNQISVPIESSNTIEFNTVLSFSKTNTPGESLDFVPNPSLDISSSALGNGFIKVPLISSFEFLSQNRNRFQENTKEYDYTEFHLPKSLKIDNNIKYSTSESLDPETFTQATNLVYDEYYKSFCVDLPSTSISSIGRNFNKDVFDEHTDSEIVFDSSLVNSQKMTDFISVFDKIFLNNELLKTDPSSRLRTDMKSSNRHKNLAVDSWGLSSEEKLTNLPKIRKSAKPFCVALKKNFKFHTPVSKSLCYDDMVDGCMSCHSMVVPVGLKSKMKKVSNPFQMKTNEFPSSSRTPSTVSYLTEVIQSSLLDFRTGKKEEQHNDSGSTNYRKSKYYMVEGNQLLLTDPSDVFPIYQVVKSSITTEISEKKLKITSSLDCCQVRNTAISFLPVSNGPQVKYLKTALQNNTKYKTIFCEIVKIEFDEVIFVESVHFSIARIASKILMGRNDKFVNLLNAPPSKLEERSAQTLVFTLKPYNIRTSSIKNQSLPRLQGTIPKDVTSNELLLEPPKRKHKFLKTEFGRGKYHHDPLSNESQDISSAVESLVDAITDIAKNHLIKHPNKTNIRRVEELIHLLPRLLKFGKEKRLFQINYLTDRLESILLQSDDQTTNKALNQIIKSIKNCVSLNIHDPARNLETKIELKNGKGFLSS